MHNDGGINEQEGIKPYVNSGKNNTWPQKQNMLQPSGKKEAIR